MARVVPLTRLLDLDDLRTHIREHHRAIRPRQHPRQIDNPHPRQRQLPFHSPLLTKQENRKGAKSAKDAKREKIN
jgi:hypothetical protein